MKNAAMLFLVCFSLVGCVTYTYEVKRYPGVFQVAIVNETPDYDVRGKVGGEPFKLPSNITHVVVDMGCSGRFTLSAEAFETIGETTDGSKEVLHRGYAKFLVEVDGHNDHHYNGKHYDAVVHFFRGSFYYDPHVLGGKREYLLDLRTQCGISLF